MKKYYLIIILIFTSVSCKAQTVIALGDNQEYDFEASPKPVYRKDINNIRDAFVGIWRGTQNSKQLTLYLYKLDGMPVGLSGARGEFFKDAIMGYYVYKENNVTLINSKNWLLEPHVPNDRQYGPIFGFTNDGIQMNQMRFVDYGIEIQNPDGSYSPKPAKADMVFTNPEGNPLKMSFKLYQGGEIVRIIYEPIEPYNHNFSIPTNMVLTKISNTPPPLD